MTYGSKLRCVCGIFLSVVLTVSGQPTSQPHNILQIQNQQDQYPHRQGHLSGPNQYQDASVVTNQQPFQHDFSHQTRNIAFAEEPKLRPQSVDFTASSNDQPTYFSLLPNQKDSAFADNPALSNKLRNLANVISRNPRPDAVRHYEPVASASEIHEEVCAPPKPNPSQNPPCVTAQSAPRTQPTSPNQNPSCSQSVPTSPKPQCSQTKAPQPKPEPNNFEPPRPAQIFTPSKHPFQSDTPENPSKSNFLSVSPLHPSSKQPESPPEPPCASPPCPRRGSFEPEILDQPVSKQIPIIPAPKPVVPNPFSENKNERIVPPLPPKGVLHHRQFTDHVEYPDGYVSKPEPPPPIIPHVPYYVYQTQHPTTNPYIRPMYPYVPPPPTKPIPLVMPADEDDDEKSDDVREGKYRHVERPSRRYGDDWSKEVLRDIADKLDAILDDDDFRGRRFSSKVYPDNERGYYEEYEIPRSYSRGYRNYIEEDFDTNRRKERKYSRG